MEKRYKTKNLKPRLKMDRRALRHISSWKKLDTWFSANELEPLGIEVILMGNLFLYEMLVLNKT